MQLVKQSSTTPLLFFMTDSSDHIAGKAGLTVTATISKNGAAFGSPAGTVAELASGWYKLTPTSADTGTIGPLALHASAAGADPTDMLFQITGVDMADTVRGGMTALPNAAAAAANGLLTNGTGAGQIEVSGTGQVSGNVKAFGGSAVVQAGGRPEVNVTHAAGAAITSSGGIMSVNLAQWRGTQPNVLVSGRVDSIMNALASAVITAAAFDTDAVDANALATDAVAELVAAVKGLVVETQQSITLQQALSLMLSVLCGRTTANGATFQTMDAGATRLQVTTDSNDQRTAITATPSA